ncbi:MAG: DUF72 domain-containing protein [Armatimonadetes bacterium]|nr:DUF72 domain-containing protein [Armatimonadota bacterium]
MGEIRIGTSGFSYDDWKGPFYPQGISKSEMLAYYASKFPTVEVNSTFYAIPSANTFKRMVEKTPTDFDFVVKAYKELTHSPEVNLDFFRQFKMAISPLNESGKLGCILAQYPWSFRKNIENMDRVRKLRHEFGELPVAVEFRNSSWISKETFELLREHNIGFCCVDEPRLHGLMPDVVVATSAIGYVRFHGRNAEKWWTHEEAWQRYDYLYTNEELSEWVPKIRKLAESCDRTYLFFNNHHAGNAAKNAQMIASLLGVSLHPND